MVDALIENPTFYKYTSFPPRKGTNKMTIMQGMNEKKITLWRFFCFSLVFCKQIPNKYTLIVCYKTYFSRIFVHSFTLTEQSVILYPP